MPGSRGPTPIPISLSRGSYLHTHHPTSAGLPGALPLPRRRDKAVTRELLGSWKIWDLLSVPGVADLHWLSPALVGQQCDKALGVDRNTPGGSRQASHPGAEPHQPRSPADMRPRWREPRETREVGGLAPCTGWGHPGPVGDHTRHRSSGGSARDWPPPRSCVPSDTSRLLPSLVSYPCGGQHPRTCHTEQVTPALGCWGTRPPPPVPAHRDWGRERDSTTFTYELSN